MWIIVRYRNIITFKHNSPQLYYDHLLKIPVLLKVEENEGSMILKISDRTYFDMVPCFL